MCILCDDEYVEAVVGAVEMPENVVRGVFVYVGLSESLPPASDAVLARDPLFERPHDTLVSDALECAILECVHRDNTSRSEFARIDPKRKLWMEE
jgi:hypothetical protein